MSMKARMIETIDDIAFPFCFYQGLFYMIWPCK
jgi:hypothetical protein